MIYDVISGLVIGSPRSFRTQDLASSSSAKITSFIPLRFLRVPAQVSTRVPLRVAARRHGLPTEVPVPTDFDLPYQDLALTTPDDVKLRCYLLTQRKELSNNNSSGLDEPEGESNEEVRVPPPSSGGSRPPSVPALSAEHSPVLPMDPTSMPKPNYNPLHPAGFSNPHNPGPFRNAHLNQATARALHPCVRWSLGHTMFPTRTFLSVARLCSSCR